MDQMKTRDTYGLDALNINGSYFIHVVLSSFLTSSHLSLSYSTGNKGVIDNNLFSNQNDYFLFLLEYNESREKNF